MSTPFPNPPVDINALLQPTTGDIVLGVMLSELVSMGIRADLWPKEGVAISCMTVVAKIFAGAINTTIIPAIKSGWLPTSFGLWLTWVALYQYGVYRVTATFATGPLTLTNGGGGSFSIPAFQATFQNAITQKTYTNLTAISLAPGPGPTQTITIQATETGTASNANPGDVTGIVTTMLGVTATNLAPVLGVDDQSDPSVQLECWNAIAANSPFGPEQSFAYAIQTAINPISGLPVNVNRWSISPSSHTGQVQVFLASPTGAADANDVLGVASNINAIARPPCVTATVASCSTVPDTDTLTVYVTSTPGLDAGTVQTAIATALTNYYASPSGNPIGGRTAGPFNGLSAAAKYGVCFDAWPPKPTDPTLPWTSSVFYVTGGNDRPLVAGQVAVDSLTVIVRLV
jgi:hypothetical protein